MEGAVIGVQDNCFMEEPYFLTFVQDEQQFKLERAGHRKEAGKGLPYC